MTRASCLLVAAVVALVACAGRGFAQPPGPGAPQRPVVSPYLNLARRDVSPAINYYGIVRPQLATYGALQSVQQQLGTLRQGAQPESVGGLPVTGQPVFFLNTGGYFLNSRPGAGPVNPSMTTRPAPFIPPTSPRPAPRAR